MPRLAIYKQNVVDIWIAYVAEVLSYGMICFGMILWLNFYFSWILFICLFYYWCVLPDVF